MCKKIAYNLIISNYQSSQHAYMRYAVPGKFFCDEHIRKLSAKLLQNCTFLFDSVHINLFVINHFVHVVYNIKLNRIFNLKSILIGISSEVQNAAYELAS